MAMPNAEIPGFLKNLRFSEGFGWLAGEAPILTATWSGEIRGATWGEIDFDCQIWPIPIDAQKNKIHTMYYSQLSVTCLCYCKNMSESADDLEELRRKLAFAERRLRRSEVAREEAESLLETKSRSLAALSEQIRRQEAELRKQVDRDTQMLVSAQDLAQVATFHIDAEGRFVGSANLAEVVGSKIPITNIQQMAAMVHPLESGETFTVLEDAIKGSLIGTSAERDVRFLDHTGATRWLRWSIGEKEEDYGFGYSAAGSVRNITEDRNAERRERTLRRLSERRFGQLQRISHELEEARERAVEADKTKSRFLAMMSHDIRTPMNALLATLELLSIEDLTPKQTELLNLAITSGDQLLLLLADIIEIARSEGWALRLDERDTELEPMVHSTIGSWAQLAHKKRLEITCSIDPEIPDILLLDPARIRQVLDNLISNAIKYTSAGSIDVYIRRKTEADVQSLHVSVVDTGDGVAPEMKERLFEDLERLENSEFRGVEGTGLGLPICKRIVTAMGGEIGVDGTPGKGSRFWFEIPLKPGSRSRLASRGSFSKVEVTAIDRLPDLHLLVAEDVEANRFVIAALLDQLGCTYEIAVDGGEVLEMAGAKHFDAILMDVSMPGIDGLEATRRLREMSDFTDLPIFGVTAFTAPDEKETILQAGMNGILSKPIDLAGLHAILQQVTLRSPPSEAEVGSEGSPCDAIDYAELQARLMAVPAESRPALASAIRRDISSWYEKFVAAWTGGNDDAVSQAHHALKGLCGAFGANSLLAKLDIMRASPPRPGGTIETETQSIFETTICELDAAADEICGDSTGSDDGKELREAG